MKRIVILSATLVLLALVALGAFTTIALAQGPNGGGPFGGWGMMGGGGMMGGRGYGIGPSQGISPTVPYGGMMGGGWGMMGGRGMMGGLGYGAAPNASTLTLDQAIAAAQQYVASLGNTDLKLAEMEEYSWNFYGVVKEKSTGLGAFQIIVEKANGVVHTEMGPAMMWNTKYSPMAWMMGGYWFGAPSGPLTVSVEKARANAQQFLKANLPNTTLEAATDTFYGYYNIDVLQNGKTYGMLSVNGYTGAVWYHTWHGDFVAARELP